MPVHEWPDAERRIAEVARTRRGRHQDKALAPNRRTRALELRVSGMGYAQIAQAVGYANKGTAHKVIAQALQARQSQDVDFLRQVETDRLNAMQSALWPKALAGDLSAATVVLRIIEARCKLLGLQGTRRGNAANDPKDSWDNCWGPRTVVINPKDCRWAGCEKHGRFDGDPVSPVDPDPESGG